MVTMTITINYRCEDHDRNHDCILDVNKTMVDTVMVTLKT